MTRLQIFVQGEGEREIRVLELTANATVRELVDAAQNQSAASSKIAKGDVEDIAVYVEDADTPLALDATLGAVGIANHTSVHLSRCKHVKVTVHYNGQDRSESLGPGAPMHRVKEWAVGKKGFNLTPVDAAEHVLQVAGTSDRPDEDVHIGSLVGTTGCSVEFDLVAKVRVEG